MLQALKALSPEDRLRVRTELASDGFSIVDLPLPPSLYASLQFIPDEVWVHRLWVANVPSNYPNHPSRQGIVRAADDLLQKMMSGGGLPSRGLVPYHYLLLENRTEPADLVQLMEEMAGPPVLKEMSDVLGTTVVERDGECYISRLDRGQFVGTHNDIAHRYDLGFVLNLTQGWTHGDGGELCMMSHKFGDVPQEELFQRIRPSFGRLTLFKIPTWHRVEEVASPTLHRYAISGGYMTAANKSQRSKPILPATEAQVKEVTDNDSRSCCVSKTRSGAKWSQAATGFGIGLLVGATLGWCGARMFGEGSPGQF